MKRITLLLPAFFIYALAVSQKKTYTAEVIAFYNLENLFDTFDNPLINDDAFTPGGERNYTTAIYRNKLHHLASVIAQLGIESVPDGPAILGVAEVENDTVLNDLVHEPLILTRGYKFVHYDSKDLRGVDVALLYNPTYFTVKDSRKLFVRLPEGAKENIFTRDVLWVKGILNGEEIHVFVNHWPSRLGGEERSAPGRAAAAMVCKHFADSIQAANSGAKIIIMGDLNDDPVSPSLTEVLHTKGTAAQVQPGGLFNPWVEMYKKGYGTLAYDDAWGLFDQILINANWLNKSQTGYCYFHNYIFNRSFLLENTGRYRGYPMRTWDGNNYRGGYSDHFPTYVIMVKRKM